MIINTVIYVYIHSTYTHPISRVLKKVEEQLGLHASKKQKSPVPWPELTRIEF